MELGSIFGGDVGVKRIIEVLVEVLVMILGGKRCDGVCVGLERRSVPLWWYRCNELRIVVEVLLEDSI